MCQQQGEVVAVCISDRKGVQKHQVTEAMLERGLGIRNDAHAGTERREVSLLGEERVIQFCNQKRIEKPLPGAFAENILTRGIDWQRVIPGTLVVIGKDIQLRVSQIGKPCHSDCAIKQLVGDCLMPREGIFAEVLRGGRIRAGDSVCVKSR
jgi:MOSC domain-containing protein YiiM